MMAKKMTITITGDNIPDDEMDRAELLGKIKPARDVFLAALKEAGITHTHETKVFTEKAKSDIPRAARGSRTPATTPASPRPVAAE